MAIDLKQCMGSSPLFSTAQGTEAVGREAASFSPLLPYSPAGLPREVMHAAACLFFRVTLLSLSSTFLLLHFPSLPLISRPPPLRSAGMERRRGGEEAAGELRLSCRLRGVVGEEREIYFRF